MIVQICVGSSCYIKGSEEIVSILQNKIVENGLEDKITLTGSFCIGKCNRVGVTIQVDDTVYTGVTRESAPEFFNENILAVIRKEGM